MTHYGSQSDTDPIRAVMLKRPAEAYGDQARIAAEWRALNYLGETDFATAREQHAAFAGCLNQAGAEICYLPAAANTGLDSVYVRDPLVMARRGAVVCQMGKPARSGEPAAMAAYLGEMGVPIIGAITGEGRLEGGDVTWLDARTVAVGQGYRSNAEGLRQLRQLLGDEVDDVIPVPLPHWTGPDDCLHLMSILSMVDRDLAVVYSRLMPVPFRQALLARGVRLVDVPDAEYDSMACNVLALAPRRCVMLAGNPLTQARLEAAGAQVVTYPGSDISIKGSGGPTCLTQAFWREV
jgi:N-dimethylarginine dimethylaminohydrolase